MFFILIVKIDAFNHIMLQFSWVFRALPITHLGIQLFEQENAVWTLVSATFLLLNRGVNHQGTAPPSAVNVNKFRLPNNLGKIGSRLLES